MNPFLFLEKHSHILFLSFFICAVSGKKINLEDLTYWNVDLQEPYFSYKEAFIKKNNEGK